MAITKPALSIFTGNKTLGKVVRENNEIVVPFTDFSTPFAGTTGNIEFNLGGKVRIIIVQGYHEGDGFDGADANEKLGDFIYEMEEWVNDGVQTKKVYTDSFANVYNVHAHNWSWERSIDSRPRIIYTLIMREVL